VREGHAPFPTKADIRDQTTTQERTMSSNADPLDVLLRLQRTRMKLERGNVVDRAAIINTIAHATNEIERLRAVSVRFSTATHIGSRTGACARRSARMIVETDAPTSAAMTDHVIPQRLAVTIRAISSSPTRRLAMPLHASPQ
jgi:hypothetical protein